MDCTIVPPPVTCQPPFRLRVGYRIVRYLLGLLFLLAAFFKLKGLGLDPVARMGIFSTPEFQGAVVEFELFMALWLLWGKWPLGSWLVAVATFVGFAAFSFYQGWVGQSSCGCFGRLSVNPWYAFGLDVLVLATLVIGRPDIKPLRENPRRTITAAAFLAACGLAGVLVTSGLLFAMAHVCFGSVPGALAYFRGERVSVQPRLAEVGEGLPGEQRRVTVEVANWTDKSIQLVGGTADCSCTVLGDLPLTIPSREVRAVSIDVSLSGRPGIFTRKAAFLVDDEGFRQVGFSLTGRIVQPKELAGSSSGRP